MFAWLFWFIQCECPPLFFFTASAIKEQLMREWQNADNTKSTLCGVTGACSCARNSNRQLPLCAIYNFALIDLHRIVKISTQSNLAYPVTVTVTTCQIEAIKYLTSVRVVSRFL